MSFLITALHVIVCVVLIFAVLVMQTGKGDIASAFGGGGSQTAFGPRSAASTASKITTACAIIFMLTSFTLAIVASRDTGSKGSVFVQTSSKK
jgi:preprotein translocase subunit SecG